MKRLICILLMVSYLSGSIELSQWLKIPFLIDHYFEHKSASVSLSFFDFLNLHYISNTDNAPDAEKDKHLPFKSHDECAHITVASAITQPYFNLKFTLRHCGKNSYSIPKSDSWVNEYLSSIWQPPKV